MKLLPLFLLLALAIPIPTHAADALLTPSKRIELPATKGRFDFIKVDATRRRLLACHTGNGSLDVISLDSGALLASVPTGNAQGVAIDDKGGRYFVSCSKPPQLAIVDADKLTVTGTVALSGPADVDAYSPALNCVVVDNDDKPEQWWIDPDAKKIADTESYAPGSGMEDLAFTPDGTILIQNLKDSNKLVTIDTSKQIVVHSWPPAPTEKPHGLALVPGSNEVLIAGGNGKLVLLDYKTGKVTASCDIAQRVDEIAFDPGNGRVYCASGTGVISVAALDGTALTAKGNVPSTKGCHSIAVDPKTHTVWIAYAAQDSTPCVQSFSAK